MTFQVPANDINGEPVTTPQSFERPLTTSRKCSGSTFLFAFNWVFKS